MRVTEEMLAQGRSAWRRALKPDSSVIDDGLNEWCCLGCSQPECNCTCAPQECQPTEEDRSDGDG